MKRKSAAFILGAIILTLGFGQQFFSKTDLPTDVGKVCWQPYSPFVEESKVVEVADCECFVGVGSNTSDVPKIVWSDGERTLVVCGFMDSQSDANEAVMTEFSVFDSKSGRTVFWSDSLTYYRVISGQHGIEVCRIAYLPLNEGGWDEVIVSKHLLNFSDDEAVCSPEQLLLTGFEIDDGRKLNLKDTVQSHLTGEVLDYSFQELLSECLVCSISGDDFARELLISFEDRMGVLLTGSDAQLYKECLEILDMVEDKRT